jgi:hypothetical protein
MTQKTQAQAAIARALARIQRPRKLPIHAGYAATVAQAQQLGLPHRSATDITIHDRLLIGQRRPRQFAWRADTRAAACSVCPSPTNGRWTICMQHGGGTDTHSHYGRMEPPSSARRISTYS